MLASYCRREHAESLIRVPPIYSCILAGTLRCILHRKSRGSHVALVLRIEQVAPPAGEPSAHPGALDGTIQVEAHRLAEREGHRVAVLDLATVGTDLV